jgi:dihydroxyacetone kinase-like protein
VAAIAAARAGVRATRPLVAKRGLALRLGERSAGHLDPGAVSCLVILVAMAGDD